MVMVSMGRTLQDGRHLGTGPALRPPPSPGGLASGRGQVLHRDGAGGASAEVGYPGGIQIRQFQAGGRIIEEQFTLDGEAAVAGFSGEVTVPLDATDVARQANKSPRTWP